MHWFEGELHLNKFNGISIQISLICKVCRMKKHVFKPQHIKPSMSKTYLAFYVVDILCNICCNITKYVATYITKYVVDKKTKHVKITAKHVDVTCFAIISIFSYLEKAIPIRIPLLRQTYCSGRQALGPVKVCCDLRYQMTLRLCYTLLIKRNKYYK